MTTQVLVVGAGPTGAVLALELAHHDVPCLVVERAVAPPRHPGVDRLTGHAMGVLRRLGPSSLVRRYGTGPAAPEDVEWRTRLDDEPVLVSPQPAGTGADADHRIPAAELTRRLRDELRAHPLIDLREGWTFTGLRVEPDGAVATVLDGQAGVRHSVAARYLVGCDGAQSTVRRCLEVPMESLGRPARHCSVFFRSADPRLPVANGAPVLVVVGGVTSVARGDGDSWVAHLPVAPEEPVGTDPVAMLRARLGAGLDVPEILGVAQWDDALAVAAAYRRGPVFLAGEAAHRFHPAGEHADTSLADAVDLGWKLAAAINGWGGPGLLASYESERRPSALIDREMVARALETRRRFGRLSAAGAAREVLAGVLRQEAHRPDAGALAGYAAVPGRRVRPGGHAPDARLDGGEALEDRFGRELTLVDLTGERAGAPLAAEATRRGIPVTHLPVADESVRIHWDRPLALVRPDRRVAWCADAVPGDWDAVLDLVSGKTT
ncbi:FAD-dependent monooxygenase [Dactylosporangium matsuzakiense]|uniref:FAD-dependent oxidoreductase n=1 Tax=Dactylosporangium matsuzakiense TaxID=53360 RepID=A0A9W6KQQ2_9ACTN|nr:FAD-dependent monooxygenase [Dactylosporangium matsuzakiense]UWZ42747.1 FAD-dependent monooxygenase [Dactylosporangium matsuzakiense]GLL05400.1 FAD-dependent oxidoreductase [Dactylosporangium matsuzakiense]